MLLNLADWLVYDVLRLSADSRLGQILNFFVYDVVKILLLLFGLIFVIGVARTFLSETTIRRWVGRRGMMGYVFAAVFGAVTPFCSCSSIPIFFGFLKAGVPLGPAFSFLITSPLINEYLVVLMAGCFGWKIALAYLAGGLLIGTCAGVVLGRMNLERFLTDDFRQDVAETPEQRFSGLGSRLAFGLREAVNIVRKIWIWVVAGVAIGAWIHNGVPAEMIQGVVAKTGPFSVLIAVALGVPMYGSCSAIVPVAVVLFQKGIPLGTALAFLMAVSALSLPEAIMLRRAMRLPLILLFFAVTSLAIVITGYVFNILQPVLI